MSTRTYKVRDLLGALEADNVPLKRGGWHDYENIGGEQVVGRACALNQIAINLGADEHSVQKALDKYKREPTSTTVGSWIMSMNDANRPYGDIVKWATDVLTPYLDEEVTLTSKFWHSKLSTVA